MIKVGDTMKDMKNNKIEILQNKLDDILRVKREVLEIERKLIELGFRKYELIDENPSNKVIFCNDFSVNQINVTNSSRLKLMTNETIGFEMNIPNETATLLLREYADKLLITREELIRKLENVNITFK